ncbi:MAG TPA: BTAD domain-containing putative transcriptional regulator [Acidimicrobiales bacterium]|nr:BTAD domain-containing putative transcriptional regulator [Acidimicrobiales bacterium]
MSSPGPGERDLLLRSQLVDGVLAAPGAVLVEAGGGFGKSVLADQVIDAAGTGCVLRLPRREPVDVGEIEVLVDDALRAGAAAVPAESALLVVDDVQTLTDDAAWWLADRVRDRDLPAVRLVACGRTVPRPLAALEFDGTATLFHTDDLRLTPEESRALVHMELDEADAERLWSALHHFSTGWIALLMLVLRRLSRAADPTGTAADLLRHPAVIGQLIDHYASELDPVDRELFVQLAHFPMVNESVADALGSRGLLRRLSHAGIPFAVGVDGWWRLSSTVKEHVVAQAPLDPELAKRGAPLLVAQGAELAAAGLLADSGDDEAAALLISQLPTGRIDAMDPRAFMRLVGRLGSAADDAPRVLLHLARTHGNVGQLVEEREMVERAMLAVEKSDLLDEPDIAVEVEAESLFLRALINDTAAEPRIDALLGEAQRGSRGQARLLEALSVLLSERPDEMSLRRAENAMRQAAITWYELGEPTRAASVQRGLAMRVLWALGKFGVASALLEKLGLTSETSYDRMLCLVFRARFLALAGEGGRVDAVLHEALSLAELLDVGWVTGYTAWTRLLVAANEDDPDRVLEQLTLAEANLGQLGDDAGGLLFLCEAAEACAVVGADGQADRLLDIARARRDEDPVVVTLTEACLDGRDGVAEAATRLGDLLDAGTVAPGMRWKVELLKGHAELAAGNVGAAGRSLQEALDHAARIGHPELAERRESRVLDTLRSAVVTDAIVGSPSVEGDAYEVTVLGRFSVLRGGEELVCPPGRPTDLVKYVAVAGGSAQVERVVEALWPDEEPGVGLRRLKNVLSRSRAAYGPLVERDGRLLRFAACGIDLSRLEQRAYEVAAGRGAERVARAREALACYTGPLLPDDLYDDLISQRRESLRRRVLGLIDVVLAADLTSGDLDSTVAVLQTAMELDQFDQERPLRVARALIDVGRDLEAHSLAAQVVGAAEELGLPPAVEWRELAGIRVSR